MHQDLFDLRNLWAIDKEMDQLKAAAAGLAEGLEKAKARVVRLTDELAAANTQVADLRDQERQVNRKLQDYVGRRDKTKKMIDEGRAPDFLAAERQFNKCAELADEAEFALLELMEAREAGEADIARIEMALKEATVRKDHKAKAQADGRPPIAAKYQSLVPKKKERWAGLAQDLQRGYADLRRRGLPVLVDVIDGCCGNCRMTVNPQHAIEVELGKRAHVCRGCNAWFWKLRETETDEDITD